MRCFIGLRFGGRFVSVSGTAFKYINYFLRGSYNYFTAKLSTIIENKLKQTYQKNSFPTKLVTSSFFSTMILPRKLSCLHLILILLDT